MLAHSLQSWANIKPTLVQHLVFDGDYVQVAVFLNLFKRFACFVAHNVADDMTYTLNNIGSLEGTLEYYYHTIPGEPLQGSTGVAW